MNVKLTNCLRDCTELESKIKEASILEEEIKNTSGDTLLQKKHDYFKLLKEQIKFLQQNIICSLPYARISEKADVNAAIKCVDLVLNAKYGDIDQEDKHKITKTLNEITDEEQMKDISEYTASLIEKDSEFIQGLQDARQVVIRALRSASAGEQNAIADYIFSEFYNIQDFLKNNEINDDCGKDIMKEICKDKAIDDSYKKAIKNVYVDYLAQKKYAGVTKGGRVATYAAIGLSVPFVLLTIGEMIGTGIIKGAGLGIKKITEGLALPFDYLAGKILGSNTLETGGVTLTDASTAAKVGAVLVDLPGIALKTAGSVANGILKFTGTTIDIAYQLALMPFELGLKGILKLGKVSPKDRIKENDKKVTKSLEQIFKTKIQGIKGKDIYPTEMEIDENSLTMYGVIDGLDTPFSVSYTINKSVFERLKSIRQEQLDVNAMLLKAELLQKLSNSKELIEEVKSLQNQLFEFTFKESNIISNIISYQDPFDIKMGEEVKQADNDPEEEFTQEQAQQLKDWMESVGLISEHNEQSDEFDIFDNDDNMKD